MKSCAKPGSRQAMYVAAAAAAVRCGFERCTCHCSSTVNPLYIFFTNLKRGRISYGFAITSNEGLLHTRHTADE